MLALLAVIGLIGAAVRLFVDSRYSIEMLLMLAAAAGSYAIWRYLRQPPALR